MRKILYGIAIGITINAIVSCRTSRPPQMSLICIGDGFGGADCSTAAGTHIYKSPSELKDYWMTTQTDEANFASWCYDAPPSLVKQSMDSMKASIKQK